MKTENLKEKIKLCLWAKKLNVVQIAAECDCDNEAVTEVLDELDDEGILQCELFEKTKTIKYWVKRDEFRIKELILGVLKHKDGVATRVQILESLPLVSALQVDSAIKSLKLSQDIHSLSRGVLKIGPKTVNKPSSVLDVICTDTPHSSKAINALYDPRVRPSFFDVKSVTLKMLDDGSLSVTAAGKSVILTPSESRQAYCILSKVYGVAS